MRRRPDGVEHPGMSALAVHLADLAALRRSPVDGTLELRYQPEVELATGSIVAMEGLLRWQRTTGLLTPGAFLDLAESSGESLPIGHWVLRAGAAEAAAWQDLPGGTRQLWLNVSLGQAREPGYADLVADVVARHDLPVGALGLELSEATVRTLGRDAAPLLHDLRDAGVALAIDDVASWYSSLGAMELLPLTAVKLGSQHVRGIDRHEGEPVAATVVRVAHQCGLYVVANGVQTWAEATRLTELGCDRAHGWLYASAQRADKARWLLTQGSGWRGRAVTPGTRDLPGLRAVGF